MQYKINKIKEAIAKANPEIREFGLAKILLTIPKRKSVSINEKGLFSYINGEEKTKSCFYNLKDDDLDHQSKKTLEFIYRILAK